MQSKRHPTHTFFFTRLRIDHVKIKDTSAKTKCRPSINSCQQDLGNINHLQRLMATHTLSGHIASWLPHMLPLQVRFLMTLHWFIICTRHWGGTAHEGGGCDQSIGSTISHTIVCSWLWLTATRSSPLGLLQYITASSW